jgi:hypothetical protein
MFSPSTVLKRLLQATSEECFPCEPHAESRAAKSDFGPDASDYSAQSYQMKLFRLFLR